MNPKGDPTLPQDSVELVLSTIAVILKPPLPQADISQEQVGTILKRPISVVSVPNVTVFSSIRDQIDVRLQPNKLEVRELSGNVTQAKGALPRVLTEFMGLLGNPSVQSFGVNFIVEVKLDNPKQWLSTRFMNPKMVEQLGQPIQLPLLSLQIDRPLKTWLVRFEVPSSDILTVNFNASESSDSLPPADVLAADVEKQHTAFIEFLRQLGAGA